MWPLGSKKHGGGAHGPFSILTATWGPQVSGVSQQRAETAKTVPGKLEHGVPYLTPVDPGDTSRPNGGPQPLISHNVGSKIKRSR